MRWMRGLCIALVAVTGSTEARFLSVLQGVPRLRPVDEARSDKELLKFRDQLIAALSTGRLEDVLASMEPTVRASVEPHWRRIPLERLTRDRDSEWVALKGLLELGGSFTTTRGAARGRREFCAPYVYSAFPNRPLPESLADEVDPWVITGEQVPVYAERKTTSRVLTRLSHAVVPTGGGWLGPDPDGTMWAAVQLPDGREGFVLSPQIRRPDDYHACFARIDGQWRMTAFERGHPLLGGAWGSLSH